MVQLISPLCQKQKFREIDKVLEDYKGCPAIGNDKQLNILQTLSGKANK